MNITHVLLLTLAVLAGVFAAVSSEGVFVDSVFCIPKDAAVPDAHFFFSETEKKLSCRVRLVDSSGAPIPALPKECALRFGFTWRDRAGYITHEGLDGKPMVQSWQHCGQGEWCREYTILPTTRKTYLVTNGTDSVMGNNTIVPILAGPEMVIFDTAGRTVAPTDVPVGTSVSICVNSSTPSTIDSESVTIKLHAPSSVKYPPLFWAESIPIASIGHYLPCIKVEFTEVGDHYMSAYLNMYEEVPDVMMRVQAAPRSWTTVIGVVAVEAGLLILILALAVVCGCGVATMWLVGVTRFRHWKKLQDIGKDMDHQADQLLNSPFGNDFD